MTSRTTRIIRLLSVALICQIGMPDKAEASALKTAITAISAGAGAVGFHEFNESQQLRDAYKSEGFDPVTSAVFDVTITLNPDAKSVAWADAFSSSDLFFVLEGSGNSSVAPFRHDGFKGGTIRHMLQGKAILPGHGFALHLYDDDNLVNDVFSALMPKKISRSVGILTPVGHVDGSIDVELQGGRVEIKKPDYIGAIAFTAPDDSDWTVSGDIQDLEGSKIGSFVIVQDSLSNLGATKSRIGLFIGVASVAVALLVGLPLLKSKLRDATAG